MNESLEQLQRRHLRFGWYALLVFLSFGAGLELMHAFKLGYYLDVDNETRRLMWRLSHAHGTLLALVNIAFGVSLPSLRAEAKILKLPSACLLVSGALLPAGFFGAGWFAQAGDPGLLVLLVPLGGVLLFIGVLGVARRS